MTDATSAIVLLVCGGRDYKDRHRVRQVLDELLAAMPIALIVHGAAGKRWETYNCPGQSESGRLSVVAEGADLFAEEWAIYNRIPSWPYQVTPAEWGRIGKRAGPIRNRRMLVERMPDRVVAFPGGRGTQNMIAQAREAGINVQEVEP